MRKDKRKDIMRKYIMRKYIMRKDKRKDIMRKDKCVKINMTKPTISVSDSLKSKA